MEVVVKSNEHGILLDLHLGVFVQKVCKLSNKWNNSKFKRSNFEFGFDCYCSRNPKHLLKWTIKITEMKKSNMKNTLHNCLFGCKSDLNCLKIKQVFLTQNAHKYTRNWNRKHFAKQTIKNDKNHKIRHKKKPLTELFIWM